MGLGGKDYGGEVSVCSNKNELSLQVIVGHGIYGDISFM